MELKLIKLSNIVTNPLQPRQEFDRDKLQELANSIKEGELLQPIVVRPNGGKYEIVAGERRYNAFQINKEPVIPCIVRDIKDDTDALEKSLIENLQRDDLTSVERENAVGELWDSGRYKTHNELAKKLGYKIVNRTSVIDQLLRVRDDRKRLNANSELATRNISITEGLTDEPRKKLLKQITDKKIKSDNVLDVVRKVKEFPEPEQQLEILEEFEQQEDTSREMFDDIIRKKKEIVEGTREPEHIVEIEHDSDKRMIQDYIDVKNKCFEIVADHILHMKTDKSKQDAIRIINDIINYFHKQLKELGVMREIEYEEE